MSVNELLASPTSQPTPSGGELGRFEAIYPRTAFGRLRQAKESYKLIKLN